MTSETLMKPSTTISRNSEDPMANVTETAKAHAQAAAERAEVRGRDHSGEDIMVEPFRQYQARAGRLQEDFKAEVRERPLRTLAIAAAVGFALGAIYRI